MQFDGVEPVTSETVAAAFYAYLGKQVGWEAVRRVHARWYEGGCQN